MINRQPLIAHSTIIMKQSPVLPKEIIPLQTYEKFHDLLDAVEQAFTTTSKRLKFMSLVSLCEGIINCILTAQGIPLAEEKDNRKKWLNFKDKLNQFILINTTCPCSNLNNMLLVNDIYQRIRNLVMHGDPDVRVDDQHVESVKDLAYSLVKYDIESIVFQ